MSALLQPTKTCSRRFVPCVTDVTDMVVLCVGGRPVHVQQLHRTSSKVCMDCGSPPPPTPMSQMSKSRLHFVTDVTDVVVL